MKFHGGKFWFTAAELAELNLPGLPASKRKVNERAAKECWALQADAEGQPLGRPRQARGGGTEYHISVLPVAAQTALVRRGIAVMCQPADDATQQQGSLWSWYARQTDKVKAEAERRARILSQIDALHVATGNMTNAVHSVSLTEKVGRSTLWEWLALVEGVPGADRLPHLAPRRKGGGKQVDVDPELWAVIRADYLRPEKPTFASCYFRAGLLAEQRGLSLPSEKTLKRRIDSEIDPRLMTAKRQGKEKLMRMLPQQRRTRGHFHALEALNIDGHVLDVFVHRRGAKPGDKPIRPVIVALQDLYSSKIVAWRIGESESAVLTRLCFADLFRDFGIPKHCWLDNGRAFASKWITGGALWRNRFKIREDEPTGLLTALGIKTHWTEVYHGQSKPIERAWGEVAELLSKHPATHGAYTGHRPDAKPENYMSTAVPWDEFLKLADVVIRAINARSGRRGNGLNGRSFDDAFNASFATAPIGRASEDHMRLALLTADQVSTHRESGEITLAHNRYWAPELMQVTGKKVTVRFDPDDLHSAIHVYNQRGEFLVTADLVADTGFDNMAAAKERAKQRRAHRQLVKKLEEQEQLLEVSQIAAMMLEADDETAPVPEPTVIRPVRVAHRNGAAAAAVAVEQAEPSFTNRFEAAVTQLRLVE